MLCDVDLGVVLIVLELVIEDVLECLDLVLVLFVLILIFDEVDLVVCCDGWEV